MPDPPPVKTNYTPPSVGERVLTYCFIILARALPMFLLITLAYSWKVATVWAVLLSVFYELIESNQINKHELPTNNGGVNRQA